MDTTSARHNNLLDPEINTCIIVIPGWTMLLWLLLSTHPCIACDLSVRESAELQTDRRMELSWMDNVIMATVVYTPMYSV